MVDLVPNKVSLYIEGPQFISALQSMKMLPEKFESVPVVGPVKLLPKRMPRTCFEAGKTTVRGYVQLGTGYNGETELSQGTVASISILITL